MVPLTPSLLRAPDARGRMFVLGAAAKYSLISAYRRPFAHENGTILQLRELLRGRRIPKPSNRTT